MRTPRHIEYENCLKVVVILNSIDLVTTGDGLNLNVLLPADIQHRIAHARVFALDWIKEKHPDALKDKNYKVTIEWSTEDPVSPVEDTGIYLVVEAQVFLRNNT